MDRHTDGRTDRTGISTLRVSVLTRTIKIRLCVVCAGQMMWMADRGNEVGQVQAADDVDQEQGPSSFKKSDDSHTLSWSIIGGIATSSLQQPGGHISRQSPRARSWSQWGLRQENLNL